MIYRVTQGDDVVFEADIDDDIGIAAFPAELLDRPAAGEPDRVLSINDRVVGVQSPAEG